MFGAKEPQLICRFEIRSKTKPRGVDCVLKALPRVGECVATIESSVSPFLRIIEVVHILDRKSDTDPHVVCIVEEHNAHRS